MRRKDREIHDNDILEIIKKCNICRIGLSSGNTPYIIPMNYGYKIENKIPIIYMHCAKEGKKLDIIKENSNVCFEIDCSHKYIKSDTPCKDTMEYESVIANGQISIVTDTAEKHSGLDLIVEHIRGTKGNSFSDNQLSSVEVLKITISEIHGKRLRV